MKFLVWSFEHRAWHKPAEAGYTQMVDEAGTYELARALLICARANCVGVNGAVVPIPAESRVLP